MGIVTRGEYEVNFVYVQKVLRKGGQYRRKEGGLKSILFEYWENVLNVINVAIVEGDTDYAFRRFVDAGSIS